MGDEIKARKFLSKLGFNEDGYTYVYGGLDSYDIKETLKSEGFIFSKELKWHTPMAVNPHKDKCFAVHYTAVLQLFAWGEGAYFPNVKDIIDKRISDMNPEIECGGYVEPESDGKIRVYATCTVKREIESAYGMTNLYEFTTEDGEVISWWTKSEPNIEIGDQGAITATFKKNSEYRGKKSTTVSRLKFEED